MKSLQTVMRPFYEKIILKDPVVLKNKTVLITGASGLIGSNLVAYLDFLNQTRKLNIAILAVIHSKREKWFSNSTHIRYFTKDLSIEKISKELYFDYLIHCATYAQPKKFLEHPEETVRLNINTLFALLKLAQTNRAKMLYLSSAEVYGEVEKKNQPTKENYFGMVNTLADRSIYVESKRLAETICFSYRNKVAIKLARVLIAYGPGLKYSDKRVISEFIKKCLEEGSITMMDQGGAIRTFCFISDAVEMLLNILLSGKELVYNVSGVDSISIRQLAQKIAHINNVELKNNIEKRVIGGTPSSVVVDNGRYCSEFGKQKFVSLNHGLSITSDWFKLIKPL